MSANLVGFVLHAYSLVLKYWSVWQIHAKKWHEKSLKIRESRLDLLYFIHSFKLCPSTFPEPFSGPFPKVFPEPFPEPLAKHFPKPCPETFREYFPKTLSKPFCFATGCSCVSLETSGTRTLYKVYCSFCTKTHILDTYQNDDILFKFIFIVLNKILWKHKYNFHRSCLFF